MFDSLKNLTDELFANAEVLEKLDGSTVFPTRTRRGWCWRTRRGISEISDGARVFAKQSAVHYSALVEECLSRAETPIFEWCSRSRWIVFDHPEDRLVLTGIRDHATGRLLRYPQLAEIAERHSVELISLFTPNMCLIDWIDEVRAWSDCEGCIVRLPNGLQYKIKSDRYNWLHQAVEGPRRDQARWYLWLTGAGQQLLSCSAGREMDLSEYVRLLDEAMDRYCIKASRIAREFTAQRHQSKGTRCLHR